MNKEEKGRIKRERSGSRKAPENPPAKKRPVNTLIILLTLTIATALLITINTAPGVQHPPDSKTDLNTYNVPIENSTSKLVIKSHNNLERKITLQKRVKNKEIITEKITEKIRANTKEMKKEKKKEEGIKIRKYGAKGLCIEIKKNGLENLTFNKINLRNESELRIDTRIENLKIKKYNTAKAYAIDPTKTNFEKATLAVKASGKELFKCAEWNFDKQECEGEWSKIMNLKPGKVYKIRITKEDPAFVETNQSDFDFGTYNKTLFNETISAVQLNKSYNNGTYTSQVFDAQGLANWTNISWTGGAPYGKELPDNEGTEPQPGGVNMTENTLLMHLDESGGTIKDSSGHENNGTEYGGITYGVDGKFGKAIKLDGVNDKISIIENVKQNFTSNFSYGAWFKADSFSTWAGIMSRMESWPNGYNLQVGTSNHIACGWGVYTKSNSMPEAGKWYHAVCVYNGTAMKLYVNGELQNDIDEKAMGTGPRDMQLGVFYTRSGSGISLPFNGTIDEAFVLNRTLSQNEIRRMYARGAESLNLSVRSCDDPNCQGANDGVWNETHINSSTEKLGVKNSRYFQYKANFLTKNRNYPPKLYNVSIGYELIDTEAPEISLEFPENNSTNSTDKTPNFTFKATDNTASTLQCSLWLNKTTGGAAEEKGTNNSVENNTTTTISPNTNLENDLYYWWIRCSDGYNSNESEKRLINISVGDHTPPTIELISPPNNTINNTDNRPEFRFIPRDDIANVLSCELWMNESPSNTPETYGSNTTIVNGSAGRIKSNTTLTNNNYTWWINCSDGQNRNESHKRNIRIHVDVNPPTVNLISPQNSDNTLFSSVNFTCSASDDIYLKNISLYSNYGGEWNMKGNKNISGTTGTATFIKNILQGNQFVNGRFNWNCLAYDNTSKSRWSSTNNSFSNWGAGSYSNTFYNNTIGAVTLSNHETDGRYISKVFDAGTTSGWKNMSWNAESETSELPDNKTISDIDMSQNVLLLHLNDGPGAAIFKDSSGEENNGTCAGNSCPTWNQTGKHHGAYRFDGNDRIEISEEEPLGFTGPFSYGAWFKADSFSTWAGIMSRMESWPNGYNLQVGTNNHIACGWGVYTKSNSMPEAGKWYHAVCVYNGTAMKLYVNGELQNDIDSGVMKEGTNNLKLGVFYTGNSLYFNGEIDEAFVFNRSLTGEEVKKIYERRAKEINVSVRSCDDPNCQGESWSEPLTNSTSSQLPVINNRYFQYKVDMEHSGGEYTPKLYKATINYGEADNKAPTITLTRPSDGKGDGGNITRFAFRAEDESKIKNCTLIINGGSAETKREISNGEEEEFNISKLHAGAYNWSINCTDINGNRNSSETRRITIIPLYKYGGRTTDINQVDIENITNLLVENPLYGLINYTEPINLSGGGDINAFVKMEQNLISVDSDNLPQLNKRARVTLYNLSFRKPIILKNNLPCGDCSIIGYEYGNNQRNNNLTFTIQGFSNYTSSENSQLFIWDDTDNNTKYTNTKIIFYANYTNRTSGESINGNGIGCQITFPDSGTENMVFDAITKLYRSNRTFGAPGVYYYNITCNDTNNNYAALNATDYASINSEEGPQSPNNISVIKSERANLTTPPKMKESESGNVTELMIRAKSISRTWQGFYGRVGGTITLKDSNSSTIYDWNITSPKGEVYASRSSDVNFADINCSTSQQISQEESILGQEPEDADSIRRTFNKKSHQQFSVGATNIEADSCNSTNLYVKGAPQNSHFYEVLLSDGASNTIYTSLLDANQTGFNNQTYDFEMLVGENGYDNKRTPYYFFVEIT